MSSTKESQVAYGLMAAVDADEAGKELANYWKWILGVGIFDLVLGILAFVYPFAASSFVLFWIGIVLFSCGCVHMTGWKYAEQGFKAASLTVGIFQVILALITWFFPGETLWTLTVLIAIMFMIDGAFYIYVAMQNYETLPAYGPTLINGALSVLISAVILFGLPGTSLTTIGILVGLNIATTGVARIMIGWTGRQIWQEQQRLPENAGKAGAPGTMA